MNYSCLKDNKEQIQMQKKFYAHSLPEKPVEKWQPLDEHLINVSKLAGEFARPFLGTNWAQLLGRHHDVGKGSFAWQAYLRHANEIVDDFAHYYKGSVRHAFQGAQWLYEHSKEAGKLMAYCIAGHHGGLPNWHDSHEAALKARLKKQFEQVEIPMDIPSLPKYLPLAIQKHVRFGFQVQFFVRMLYSCLVDADYLDTERALDKAKAEWRSKSPELPELHSLFWKNFNALRDSAEQTKVKRQREIVLSDCIKTAQEPEGLFSLTVPTGGGKLCLLWPLHWNMQKSMINAVSFT
jgi:CRISPR-associated endonuclease/helicase Cas3